MLAGGDRDAARAALGGDDRRRAAAYLASWRSHVEWLAERLDGVRAVYYTGRGPSLAAAGSAGLITKESTHRPSEGMSSAAFRHGPMEMLDEDVFLLAFAGAARTRALNEALVADVRAAGAPGLPRRRGRGRSRPCASPPCPTSRARSWSSCRSR